MNQNICLNKKSLSSDLRQYYEFETILIVFMISLILEKGLVFLETNRSLKDSMFTKLKPVSRIWYLPNAGKKHA